MTDHTERERRQGVGWGWEYDAFEYLALLDQLDAQGADVAEPRHKHVASMIERGEHADG